MTDEEAFDGKEGEEVGFAETAPEKGQNELTLSRATCAARAWIPPRNNGRWTCTR